MRILALDTTTRGGSVAVLDETRVIVERAGDATRTHAERLPRELLEALEIAGLGVADVDLFAVAAGPGSFTGLRIGIAAMQGLAVVTGRRMLAVSMLDVLGHLASEGCAPGARVGAWIDAHRRDVFSALYEVGDGPPFGIHRLRELDPPVVGRPEAIVEAWMNRSAMPAAIAGDGALLYAAAIGPASEVVAPPPLAGAIGRIALARAHAGGSILPAAVQPLYVRRPDAEIARAQGRDG